jgi:hypothetical protein
LSSRHLPLTTNDPPILTRARLLAKEAEQNQLVLTSPLCAAIEALLTGFTKNDVYKLRVAQGGLGFTRTPCGVFLKYLILGGTLQEHGSSYHKLSASSSSGRYMVVRYQFFLGGMKAQRIK